MSSFDGWTLEQLRERARLNQGRGIRVSPELRAAIAERETAPAAGYYVSIVRHVQRPDGSHREHGEPHTFHFATEAEATAFAERLGVAAERLAEQPAEDL